MPDHLEKFMTWAREQANIRAVILLGSRAREKSPADDYSDYDLDIYVTDHETYHDDDGSFAHAFGTVWVNRSEPRGDGFQEFMVLYEGGAKLDFSFVAVSQLTQMTATQSLHFIYERGYQVLLDKDQLTTNLPPATGKLAIPPKPTEEDFQKVVHNYLYDVVYIAKQIARRQLWTVKHRDMQTKRTLLQMLEWHTLARQNWVADIWHDGRFIADWVDGESKKGLDAVFAHYDARDSWRALIAQIALFDRVASETAQHLGYGYPKELRQSIVSYLIEMWGADQ